MPLPFRVQLKSRSVARCFWETWERIPEADQAILGSHLLIVSDSRAFCPFDLEGCAVALTLGTGDKCVIYLNVRRMAHYKPPLTRAIIAHELAHVFCKHYCGGDQADAARQAEADEQAVRWGFIKANYELNRRRARPRLEILLAKSHPPS